MKFIIVSSGSAGDVIPLIALALKLQEQGHKTIFYLPHYLASYSEKYGLETVQLGREIEEKMLDYQERLTEGRLTECDIRERNEILIQMAPHIISKLRSLCRKADGLIGLKNFPFLPVIHQKTGIPIISIQFAYPGFEDPAVDVAGYIHKLPAGNQNSLLKKHLVLYALSRILISSKLENNQNHHITGFFFNEDTNVTQSEPDAGLIQFIESGPAPVIITMGSTKHQAPGILSQLFIKVINSIGCRAVIQQGWSGLGKDQDLPDHIYSCHYIPHTWLFPRASCIIHHGGAGTTAASLYSGTPAIIIPHFIDQFTFADQLEKLNCIGATIPYPDLSETKLENALRKLFTNEKYKKTTAAISQRIREEKGVDKACSLILDFLK